jgi:hypothetical protein
VAVDVRRDASNRTLLGLPIGVGRTVELNRRLSDDEWERLVVRCREVFQAAGSTRSDGSLRQWANGNLRVLLEPSANGQRLRFGTVHSGARASISSGLALVGVSVVMGVAAAVGGGLAHAAIGVATMAFSGLGMIAFGGLRLPRWARLRAQQMESLAVQAAVRAANSGSFRLRVTLRRVARIDGCFIIVYENIACRTQPLATPTLIS